MCLPHDPPSLLRWLETQICVLAAWRDDLAVDPAQRRRAIDIDRGLFALEREAESICFDWASLAAASWRAVPSVCLAAPSTMMALSLMVVTSSRSASTA